MVQRGVTIEGVVRVPFQRHEDERGHFTEMYRRSIFGVQFTQLSHSRSKAGVLRGLHYHRFQSDLWHLVRGRAQVCFVDLRRQTEKPTVDVFETDADENISYLIPPGVAHGFLALSEIDLVYLTTHEYTGDDEHGIAWNDPSLAIDWAIDHPVLSERDAVNPDLDWARIPAFS